MTMPYPQVSAAVLLYGSDRPDDSCPSQILLTKRISAHQDGKYGCPGGKTDFGETLKKGIERELFEETGIWAECEPTGYLANCVYHNEGKHFLCVWFAARTNLNKVDFVEKDVKGNPKCEGWKFFSYEQALYLPMMPSTLDAWLHHQGPDSHKVVIKEYSDAQPDEEKKDKKVVKILLEYDNGEQRSALGEDATKIWEHIEGVEGFSHIMGCVTTVRR